VTELYRELYSVYRDCAELDCLLSVLVSFNVASEPCCK